MPTGSIKHVYRPQRTFDDDLMDLSAFFTANDLSIDGVDAAALAAAVEAQRAEQSEEGRLVGAKTAHHETFIRQQRARFDLFRQALAFARAKYRTNPAKLAELGRFTRRYDRSGASTSETPDPTE